MSRGMQIQFLHKFQAASLSLIIKIRTTFRQGDILVSLDKTDATIALNKAKNNLANIVRQTNKLYLQDKQYSAEVASARIQYQQSLEDYNRRVPLAKQGLFQKKRWSIPKIR